MQATDLPGDAPFVLFVDDEPTSRKWFAREFGDEFKVATAASADEALAILGERSHEFGVMVTDYRMPERDTWAQYALSACSVRAASSCSCGSQVLPAGHWPSSSKGT